MANDVIAAIATASGRAGIGVVRISGPQLQTLLSALVRRRVEPRLATLVSFIDGDNRNIDQGLISYFPAPRSYTGEDVIELHAHGSPVVLQLLLARCLELGARVAEPGEFTRRAFLNDKLDLAQAEAVADLIDASTAEAARCALRSMEGEFSRQITAIVSSLIELRTLVEATLDFPEEDVELLERTQVAQRLKTIHEQVAAVFATARQGSLLREGVNIVLAGAPNVGKSSLLNCLAGADRAIVTEHPGTTRDAIRESISVHGVPLHVIDTAGLRDSNDPVEKIGISKSWEAISKADIVLWVSDASRPQTLIHDSALATRIAQGAAQIDVVNKIDLVERQTPDEITDEAIRVSAMTGTGIELLRSAICGAVGWQGEAEGLYMARARHLGALELAKRHLASATARMRELELMAEDLRLAQIALASISGEFTADDLLGEIFSRFCIGK